MTAGKIKNNNKKKHPGKAVKSTKRLTEIKIPDKRKGLPSDNKIRKILSSGKIGLWELNPKNNLFKATPITFEILGIKCPSLILDFNVIKDMISKKEDRENIEKKLFGLSRINLMSDTDLRIHTGTKEKKYIRLNAVKLDNTTLGGTLKDVTEVRKIEKELIKSKTRAEKADHFKSAFLTNLSHELRTPMNAIMGFTELLNQGALADEQKTEYTKIIKNKAYYLLSLIDDINELVRFETGQVNIRKTRFNIYPVIKELFDEFESKRIESGKFNVTLLPDIPDDLKQEEIYTDQGRLHQLMSILLNNAIKYTDKGTIEFGFKISDEDFKFFVNDTGIGMTEDEQRSIFFRFSKIEETAAGLYGRTGFSLTVSRHIVEMLGGKIKVKSELNKGSRFQFSIPYTSQGEIKESGHNLMDDITTINWKDKVILVAEDEDLNYKFIETLLHKTQAQVLRAKNGSEAVELCKKIPQINIVLMDIKMPVMNGFEATAKIKKIRKDIPVIAQTAFSAQEEIIKCKESGCVDYISKPIDIAQLLELINKYS